MPFSEKITGTFRCGTKKNLPVATLKLLFRRCLNIPAQAQDDAFA